MSDDSGPPFGAVLPLDAHVPQRPIRDGEERMLNLFEPRWLALMDDLALVRAVAILS